MNVVKAGFEPIKEDSITKKIEKVARVCYKSEDKIGVGSDIEMLKNLKARKHYAMLEHASLVYVVTKELYELVLRLYNALTKEMIEYDGVDDIVNNIRLRFTATELDHPEGSIPDDALITTKRYVVSGNIRAWVEFYEWVFRERLYGASLDLLCHDFVTATDGIFFDDFEICGNAIPMRRVTDLSTLTDCERMVHEDVSLLFTVDRGVTHEIVRMRDCSFAQESTRYCNYSKGKFGNEITVIKPLFFEEGSEKYRLWAEGCKSSESAYFALLTAGAIPQEARDVLPQSVKADIVVTTNLLEWKHIFELRACDLTGPAHPQMKEVMIPALKYMQSDYGFAFGKLVAAEK